MNTLVIRADSTEKIGTGHIMRCIALAHAWQEAGGDVVFVISTTSEPLEERITHDSFSVSYVDESPGSLEDADQTRAIAQHIKAGWIILDGYQFGDEYQEQVCRAGEQKLLVIDDYGHAKNTHADIVLNPNIYASMELYPHHLSKTRFLLGGRYTLLRREFLKQKKRSGKMQIHTPRNILVTMGGSDPDNVTKMVLDTLMPLVAENSLSVTAIIGGMNRHFNPGDSPYAGNPSVRIVCATDEMPDLICNADMVITGAGSTAWEIAFLGRPMIAVVLTKNQERVAAALELAGAAIVIGDLKNLPDSLEIALCDLFQLPEKCIKMAASGQQLVDGEGIDRVVLAMRGGNIRLRDVREEDKELLLRWANDPVVRKNAFGEAPIDRATHERWFATKLHSADCTIYIAVDAEEMPVGQVRFDREGESAEVDISIDSSKRQKGLGVELLVLGTAKIFYNTDIKNINASVISENIASIKMFEQAGFTVLGKDRVRGAEVVRFVCHRPHLRL